MTRDPQRKLTDGAEYGASVAVVKHSVHIAHKRL